MQVLKTSLQVKDIATIQVYTLQQTQHEYISQKKKVL